MYYSNLTYDGLTPWSVTIVLSVASAIFVIIALAVAQIILRIKRVWLKILVIVITAAVPVALAISAIGVGHATSKEHEAVYQARVDFMNSYPIISNNNTYSTLGWPKKLPENDNFYNTTKVYKSDGKLISIKLVYQNDEFSLVEVLPTGDLKPLTKEE